MEKIVMLKSNSELPVGPVHQNGDLKNRSELPGDQCGRRGDPWRGSDQVHRLPDDHEDQHASFQGRPKNI